MVSRPHPPGRPAGPPRRPPPLIPRGSLLLILLGVGGFLVLRQLPPDNSLALIRQDKVLNVCVPPDLPPYLSASDGTGQGSEAELVRRLARRIGVDVGWSLQSGWLTSPDPVDWGLRPESCDLLAGGIVDSEDTRALMTLTGYQTTGWTVLHLGGRAGGRLAILNPHWGLSSDPAFDWADKAGLEYDLLARTTDALDGVRAGKYRAVLALAPENRWLLAQQDLPAGALKSVPELGRVRLALGVWKTRITLRRAVAAVVGER